MKSDYFEARILRALDTVSPPTLQMRLAAMADRDLAIALGALAVEDRDALLARLPAAKARRVRQEREYLGNLFISGPHRIEMAERLADAMEGKGGSRGGTWIAPGRDRRS